MSLFRYFVRNLRDKGLASVLRVMAFGVIHFIYYKKIKRQNNFNFQGSEYQYYYSLRNVTWLDERCVEIPIAVRFVEEYKRKRILEVGNVLSNYFIFQHDIVDKYEIANGVINKDIVDFKSDHKYDLIISISTLEHVGWDEHPRDDTKILRAIYNMQTLLSREGIIVVSIPFGYNRTLDELIAEGKIHFSQQFYLRRISKGNKWMETSSLQDVLGTKYGQSFSAKGAKFDEAFGANALLIGIIKG